MPKLIVTPHWRDGAKHPNAFDARLDGDDAILCTSDTPLLDSARVLLKTEQAGPDDMLEMWHFGSKHFSVRGKVGRLAELTISEPKGAGRLRLVKRLDFTTVWPRINANEK